MLPLGTPLEAPGAVGHVALPVLHRAGAEDQLVAAGHQGPAGRHQHHARHREHRAEVRRVVHHSGPCATDVLLDLWSEKHLLYLLLILFRKEKQRVMEENPLEDLASSPLSTSF